MSITVNLYYTGENGNALKFAREMESNRNGSIAVIFIILLLLVSAGKPGFQKKRRAIPSGRPASGKQRENQITSQRSRFWSARRPRPACRSAAASN